MSFDRPAVNAACCLIIHILIVFLVNVETQANPAYYGQDSHNENCEEDHKLEGRTPRHRSSLTFKQRSESHKLLLLSHEERPSRKSPTVPGAECCVAFSGQQRKRGEAVGMASRINVSPWNGSESVLELLRYVNPEENFSHVDSIRIVDGMVFGRKTGFHTQWGEYFV